MADETGAAAVIPAVRAATVEVAGIPAEQRARFALALRPEQDPVALAESVTGDLSPLGALVAPLSALEPEILVVELPGRAFGPPGAAVPGAAVPGAAGPGAAVPAAFAAAYALADAYGAVAAEPDLHTDFFPVAVPYGPGEEPAVRSVDGFPPGCWAGGQPELERNTRWSLDAMRVGEAWDYSNLRQRPSHGEGVLVAQPDTGVTRHVELDGVRTIAGFDVLRGLPDPTDPLDDAGNPGHGTGTASVLVSPPEGRVTGSAPRARHMPIRAVRSVVRLSQISVAQAIDWALAHGAEVITMSLGGMFSFSLHRAVRRAVQADVIVLAAAGNCVRTVVWPARFDECLAVAGTDSADRPWRGSCRGAAVDISAPAQNVFQARVPRGTGPGGSTVGQGQGTSFAVALTAGVAALWLAHHGRANLISAARARGETLQAMFRRLVRATARRPAGWDPSQFGAGIVDARALLEAGLDLGRDGERARRSAAPAPRGAPAPAPPVPIASTPAAPVPAPPAPAVSVPAASCPATPGEPAAARAAASVRSLVADVVGHDAVSDEALDWHRFGPELSAIVLHRQLVGPAARQVPEPGAAAGASPPRPSGDLAAAVCNPRLRDWLRLGVQPGSTPLPAPRPHTVPEPAARPTRLLPDRDPGP